MFERITYLKSLPVPKRMVPDVDPATDAGHSLVLIGDGSDADEVLSYFREMWPEVEGGAEPLWPRQGSRPS